MFKALKIKDNRETILRLMDRFDKNIQIELKKYMEDKNETSTIWSNRSHRGNDI